MVDISRLKELGNDRLTIMLRILSSQGLCKAIKYNNTNFLSQPDMDDPSELIYTQVYPYKRVPDNIADALTFITLNFTRYRPVGAHFKSGIVEFNILVHKANMKTDLGMLRTDYIASEIDILMNQERGLGIGKAEFNGMDDLYLNADYMGVALSYKILDFN